MKRRTIKSRVSDYLYDHHGVKETLNWTYALFLCTVSAIVFTIGYKFFPAGLRGSRKLLSWLWN